MKKADLDLLRPLWVPQSFIEEENCTQTLKIWLSDGNYYVNNSPPELSLFCLDTAELRKSLSLDAFRFAAHAAQTVHEMEKMTAYEKLTSWRVIQCYYASYYAAHSILRFFGRSFSHLESGHARFLRQRCLSEAGYSPEIQSSYYLIEFNPSNRTLGFETQGESHKDLWKCFLALTRLLEREALNARASDIRRQELSAYFSDLALALTNRGQFASGNWLSSVRNEVNYKSSEGVWFPFSKRTPSFETLRRKVKNWRGGGVDLGNPNLERGELERFFATAFTVVDLGICISLDYQSLANRSGQRSSNFSKLLNMNAVA